MIANALTMARQVIIGKSPCFGMMFASGLGLGAAEVMGLNLNTVIIVALCGAAGAFFGCLPRLITAMSGADATARGLLSRELRMLLLRINRLEQRVVLEQNAKHIVQSEHNNLVVHIGNLRAMLAEAGGTAPEFKIKTYEQMLGPIDKEIKELMLGDPEEK